MTYDIGKDLIDLLFELFWRTSYFEADFFFKALHSLKFSVRIFQIQKAI